MSDDKHKIDEQTETREIVKRVCAQQGCEFFGRDAQQGVCHDTDGDLIEWAKLDAHEKELSDSLKEMREREGDDYVVALESYYVSAMMNWQCTLDECIRLRRDNALLKVRSRS